MERNGSHDLFVCIRDTVDRRDGGGGRQAQKSRRVGVLWDGSASRKDVNARRQEVEVLKTVLSKLGIRQVAVHVFRNALETSKMDWRVGSDDLLNNVIYDGVRR